MIHQPQAAVKPDVLGQRRGQGAGQDAAVGVVPQVALAVAVFVADGQQGVGGVAAQEQRRPQYCGAALLQGLLWSGFPLAENLIYPLLKTLLRPDSLLPLPPAQFTRFFDQEINRRTGIRGL